MNNKKFDIVIIGGGATGSGAALDATLRGFKCLLVEKNDFAEGTSSRSTKLVHGGVRYLEAAVKKLDINQYNLVKEGLKERYRLLKNAPYLAHPITLVTPLYKWYEIPYIYVGLVLYDLISGKRRLGRSQIVCKDEIVQIFPSVKKDGLKGGVRYYDGAFNDAKMALTLVQSAQEKGCVVKNYNEVVDFEYKDEKISGVKIKDKIKDEVYSVDTDFVINATGVFCDVIRRLDEKDVHGIVEASSGIHIVLDKKFLPNNEGLMIPKTEDGRVLFMLPWMDKCLVGTTDEESSPQDHPKVDDKDIEYLLRHMRKYFSINIEKSDILSSWSGLRPLVSLKHTNNTKELVREHYIEKSKSNLVSITGGKWTSYRKMAEDVVDLVEKLSNRKNLHTCCTKHYKLFGNRQDIVTIKEKLDKLNLEIETSEHLLKTYGSNAMVVVDFIKRYGTEKIHKNYPVLKAEIYYAVEHEFVKSPLDFLVRRVNLGLIDMDATKESLKKVAFVLKESFGWSDEMFDFKIKEASILLNEGI
ncbi:MAG: FAD-dependent oxidoreductase [Sulfurospirillum sp.]